MSTIELQDNLTEKLNQLAAQNDQTLNELIAAMLKDKRTLAQHDAILKAVNEMVIQFLQTGHYNDEIIQQILARLGEATDVSRVYIFQNNRSPEGQIHSISQSHEWVAPAIPPQIDNRRLQNFQWKELGLERWEILLSQGKPIYGHVLDFPEEEHAVLLEQDIQSIAVMPIFANQNWWGFIGFDYCYEQHEWSVNVLEALQTAASILGATIWHHSTSAALVQSEEQYRTLFEKAPDAIILEDQNENILDANPAACELFGYSYEELCSMTTADLQPAVLREKSKPRRETRFETIGIYKDGHEIPLEITMTPFSTTNRTYLAIVRDMSSQKEMEKALREKDRQHFEEINQLKDELIQTVSHDLKNPISVIQGYVGLLMESSDIQSEEDIACLESIDHNARRMNQLITDLLDVARIESGMPLEFEVTELDSLLQVCMKEFWLIIERKHIDLAYIPPPADLTIEIDANRIAQVMSNLLSNAIKYTPSHGQIEVRNQLEEDHLVLTIKDSGPGIPAEYLPHLFKKFYRVPNGNQTIKGTGLGLFISHSIIEQHHGNISVKSEIDKGTSFIIKLPLRQPH